MSTLLLRHSRAAGELEGMVDSLAYLILRAHGVGRTR
jgi:hypothetical protein